MMGIVDVGGGMRGVFGCGVTDFLLDNDIPLTTAWEYPPGVPI